MQQLHFEYSNRSGSDLKTRPYVHLIRPTIALALGLLPVALFSLFLVSHGLDPLPDSVLVKANYLDPGQSSRTSQTLVQNFVGNAMDMTAQTTINAEKGEMRTRLTPVFQTTGRGAAASNPLIPGGN